MATGSNVLGKFCGVGVAQQTVFERSLCVGELAVNQENVL
jgi:hypothetical protein